MLAYHGRYCFDCIAIPGGTAMRLRAAICTCCMHIDDLHSWLSQRSLSFWVVSRCSNMSSSDKFAESTNLSFQCDGSKRSRQPALRSGQRQTSCALHRSFTLPLSFLDDSDTASPKKNYLPGGRVASIRDLARLLQVQLHPAHPPRSWVAGAGSHNVSARSTLL